MSYFPSPVMVRLQELRLWQGNYDNIIQNKSKDATNPSDYETIEELAALDTTRESAPVTPLSSPGRRKNVDWDQKTISPCKPFDQLLEEKLAEDKPGQLVVKQKKPFLKKGAGLVRYKLKGQNESLNKQKRLALKNSVEIKIRERQPVSGKKARSTPSPRKSCLKNNINVRKEPKIDLTPLKMPDLVIKPKGTWHKAQEKEMGDIPQEPKTSSDMKTPKHHINSHLIGKMNEFALQHFLPSYLPKNLANFHRNNNQDEIAKEQGDCEMQGNESSFEKLSENELRIFEALEERAGNSSFSSTNSSILRLLSSTPNKLKITQVNSPILEENKTLLEEQFMNDYCHQQSTNVDQKVEELNVNSDVLHDFLKSLRKIGVKSDSKRLSGDFQESANEKSLKDTPDTSFSDEDKWLTNSEEDTPSRSPSSFSTEFDTTYKGDASSKVDIAVNTSFDDEKVSNKCRNCEKLRLKLEKLSKEIPDIKSEKAKVWDFAKDLEKKRDQLNKEMQKMKKKYESELCELRNDFNSERKKFSKDKMLYEVYLKDSQSRPSRKEREEVADLKKELTEAKELMKMKDTKNGSTQARLRNQIRQLEKENNDLKTNMEKLQKENAKLTATNKVRKPSEVKMLHEINRNLTKLTEETLKNNLNKPDKCNNTPNSEEIKSAKISKDTCTDNKEVEPSSPRGKKKHAPSLKNKHAIELTSSDETNGTNMTTFANFSLEKQYENVFGQVSSPRTNNSISDSKRDRVEKVFEDGSREIKYSNGNKKTISPDGNLVLVKYYNGDVKETNLLENTLKYYYSENETWHTQFSDGTELLEYPSGQREKKYKDGRKEILCVDGSRVLKLCDGSEEVFYPDGSKIVIQNIGGERILYLPNGQKEVHSKDHKRREYPDGTVKILFPDGTQETRYASGRIRVKNANGVLIMDSQNSIS